MTLPKKLTATKKKLTTAVHDAVKAMVPRYASVSVDARDLRRHSSEAHKALARRFAEANLGRHTFKRHAVVGSAIVDFNCHSLGMAIDIFEEGENEALAKRRDASLDAVGIKVMRIKASEVLENMDGVLERITAGMRQRIEDKKNRRYSGANETDQRGPTQ